MRKELHRMERREAIALLERSHIFHMATTRPDGTPVLRTLHGVVMGEAIAFHGAPVGEKSETLGRPAVVSVEEVVTSIPSYFLDPRRACPATTYYRSVQAHGVIQPVTDPAEKAAVLAAFMCKYQPEGGYEPLEVNNPLYRGAIGGLMICKIPFETLDGKAKLGQNRRHEELGVILQRLWERGLSSDPAAIELIRAANPGHPTPEFLQGPAEVRLVCQLGAPDAEEAADLLTESYWNAATTREQMIRAHLAASAWVGAKDKDGRLIATARAMSDSAKHAWIYDVMVAPEWRGQGLGKALIRLLLDHPRLRHAAIVRLGTRDAQGLYEQFGFVPLDRLPPKPYATCDMLLRRHAVPIRA